MAQSQTVHYRIKKTKTKTKTKQNKTNKIKTKQTKKSKLTNIPLPKKTPNPMTSTKRWLNTILAKYQERFEYQEHKIEDTARVIRSRKSKKRTQYNGQKKKDKQ